MNEAVVSDDSGRVPSDGSNPKLTDAKYTRKQGDGSRVSDSKDRKLFKSDGSRVSDSKDRKFFKTDGSRVTRTEGMHNHPEFALITVAVDELEKGLMELGAITYKSVDELMQGISKRNNISPTLLHNQFKAKHLTIPDNWAIRKRMNKMKGIEEATMTAAQKRKDTRLKKKYDDSDMKKNMQKQYGKEEGKNIYFATIRKQAMKKEEYISELSDDTMDSYLDKAAAQVEKRSKGMNRAAGLIVKRLTRSKPPTPQLNYQKDHQLQR